MATKAELRDVLIALDDDPPATWRKDELEERVAEWSEALDTPILTEPSSDVAAAQPGDISGPFTEDHKREVPPPLDDNDLLPATIEAGAPEGQLPELSKWHQLEAMADRLAQSRLVPPALYRRPDDVLLVLLTSHDLGIPATQALSKVHIIEGKPTIAAELMVALVLREGHAIWPIERTDTHATWAGQRKGSAEVIRVTYSWKDAEQAKLTNKDNYKRHPRAMMSARAVSELARVAFPDVLAGATYTPEELGAIVDVGDDGEVVVIDADGARDVAAHGLASDEDRDEIRAMIERLDDDEKAALREMWTQAQHDRKLTSLAQLRADHVDAAKALILEVAPHSQPEPDDPDVPDAELVPEDAPTAAADDEERARRVEQGLCIACGQGGPMNEDTRSESDPEYHKTCEPF